MKILVVEDEIKTGTYLRQGLTEAGFVCDLALDGVTGLHQLMTESYNLAILDVMLPGYDGWTLLRELRKNRDTPILLLTARNDVGDRVKGLELDLIRRKARRQDKTILLTAKEFAMLWLLMRRQGEILPRCHIASQVWGINFSSDTNIVDAAIRRLRAKIDDEYDPKLIHTVRGMGYVLERRGDATS